MKRRKGTAELCEALTGSPPSLCTFAAALAPALRTFAAALAPALRTFAAALAPAPLPPAALAVFRASAGYLAAVPAGAAAPVMTLPPFPAGILCAVIGVRAVRKTAAAEPRVL